MADRSQYAPGRWWRLALSGGAVAGLAVILAWNAGRRQTTHAQTVAPPTGPGPQVVEDEPPELLGAESLSRAFRTAAQKALPAVVVIKAGTSPLCPSCGRAHEAEDGDGSAPDAARQKSLDVLGSGFIVDPSGIVLTNKHVVKGSRKLFAQTADGKQFAVKQLSTDQEHDAAVLRLDTKSPLPFVRLGDSEKAEIGDWVLTIGCPLELEQTVSAGIISAKNRSFCSKHQARYLQTDAVINPGSSGGPLVGLNGTVIGITTAIASDDGGYQGIGFAVPANFVKQLLVQFTQATSKEPAARDSIRQ
jgi:serine protease Do